MYVENTTTGMNLIDLTRREAFVIKDSLRRAQLHCQLTEEEGSMVEGLIRKIEVECSQKPII